MAHVISSGELRQKIGLSRRQFARIASFAPGAIRANGYHWSFPASPALKAWVTGEKLKVALRKVERFQPVKVSSRTPPSLSDLCTAATASATRVNAMISASDPIAQWSQAEKKSAALQIEPLLDQMVKLLDAHQKMLPLSPARPS